MTITPKVQLIYFRDCPNFAPLKQLLMDAGIEFEEICQDDLENEDVLRLFSSPTLLAGGVIIWGSKTKGGSCSVGLPTKDKLLSHVGKTDL